ncbi:porin family protein [uncultured Prevotella sp.]|uniref:porin family protein n=1 Tax=uncultured Prevotella sp. TaxID=159272 RepID=UPI0027E2EB75|nr:porin family protein [uncultured Prevotella sp.]
MRKIFTAAIVAATMLFSTSSAQAQVKFGLKGGLNVTNMSLNSEVLDADNQTGFFIGPTVKFTLPIVGLGIDASALYDQRDAKITVEDNGASVESKIKNQSINIPINLRYGVGLGSTASVYLFAGPQFGFNVGDKNQSIFKDMGEWRLKSSTFSVNVGLGAMLLSHLQISANYNIACGKTGETTVSSALGELAQSAAKKRGRANAWQIGLAYYF